MSISARDWFVGRGAGAFTDICLFPPPTSRRTGCSCLRTTRPCRPGSRASNPAGFHFARRLTLSPSPSDPQALTAAPLSAGAGGPDKASKAGGENVGRAKREVRRLRSYRRQWHGDRSPTMRTGLTLVERYEGAGLIAATIWRSITRRGSAWHHRRASFFPPSRSAPRPCAFRAAGLPPSALSSCPAARGNRHARSAVGRPPATRHRQGRPSRAEHGRLGVSAEDLDALFAGELRDPDEGIFRRGAGA